MDERGYPSVSRWVCVVLERCCRVLVFVLHDGGLCVAPLRSAQADPARIDLAGEVTASTLFTLSPGDPVHMTIFVDSEAPDENPAAGAYLATAPGTFVMGTLLADRPQRPA